MISFAGFCVTVFQNRIIWFHVPGGLLFFSFGVVWLGELFFCFIRKGSLFFEIDYVALFPVLSFKLKQSISKLISLCKDSSAR